MLIDAVLAVCRGDLDGLRKQLDGLRDSFDPGYHRAAESALSTAGRTGNLNAAFLILDEHLNPLRNRGDCALALATTFNHACVMELLFCYGAPPVLALRVAARENNLEAARVVLAWGPFSGCSLRDARRVAESAGNDEFVQLLDGQIHIHE